MGLVPDHFAVTYDLEFYEDTNTFKRQPRPKYDDKSLFGDSKQITVTNEMWDAAFSPDMQTFCDDCLADNVEAAAVACCQATEYMCQDSPRLGEASRGLVARNIQVEDKRHG